MDRLWYIKAIVVPDGQRRLLCTAAEVPIKLLFTNYSCHVVPILLVHAVVIERPCRLSCYD